MIKKKKQMIEREYSNRVEFTQPLEVSEVRRMHGKGESRVRQNIIKLSP